MILFLDYDGVLHPDKAYHYHNRGVVLECQWHALFEHADTLAELLEPHPEVRIVLSTSWVSVLGFDRAKGYLPKTLQKKVRGATYHTSLSHWWPNVTRFQQIAGYLARHQPGDWIAVDDDDEGWPDEMRHHLVHTNEWSGLGDHNAQEVLAHKLANGVVK